MNGEFARFPLENHSGHDYRALVVRWRQVARACGLRLTPFAESSGYPVYQLQTRDRSPGGLYVSAGIHGDEPGGGEGLILWAERHLPALLRRPRSLPLLLLPCLNPWGLVNNRRSDEAGHDLNRLFKRDDLAPLAELKRLLRGRRFDLALHLHEDYDARGSYLYELHKLADDWGHGLLAACRRAVPIDPRRRIDGRLFDRGLWLRRRNLRGIPQRPEAVHLYKYHCPRVLTFETPSEFDLARRAQAHVLLLRECVRRLLAAPRKSSADLPR